MGVAQAGGHAAGDHLDDGAERGAGLAHGVEQALPGRGAIRVRAEERVLVDGVPVPAAAVDRVRSHLDERAADRHWRAQHWSRTLRATAPAATRLAVSRADERPPPR